MRKPREVWDEKWSPAAIVIAELLPIARKHKKITIAIVVFHLWCYSLVFRHLQDIKDITEMFPILGSLFGK